MAAFAPVAPIQILEALQTAGALGDYHLFLAHHVLEHPERFSTLAQGMKGATIIMDNSIVELGTAENDAKVLEACRLVDWGAKVIPVLADVMGDGAATREAATASYEYWDKTAPGYSPMVVLQGINLWDFCRTADYFLLNPYFQHIKWVGIPRKLTELIGSRQEAIKYVRMIRPDVYIHLLGFSDNVPDDLICTSMLERGEGIDSAVPIRYSSSSPDNPHYVPSCYVPPRPPEWFEKGTLDTATLTNLQNVRKWTWGNR